MTLRTDADPEPVERVLKDARLSFHDLDPDGYVVVVGADAGMHVQAGSLDIGYAGRGTYAEPDKQPDQQELISASWSQVMAPSSTEATVTVTGSFTVAVWGPTLDVEHTEGNETWQSGPHNERAVDPDGNVAVVNETWIYLDVRDGRLTVVDTEVPEGSLIAAAEGGALAVGGSLQAQGAVGRFLGRSLEGDDVTISGSLQAEDLSVHDGRLAFTLTGTADSYILDVQRIAVTHGDGPSWLWSLLAVPLAAAWLVRRQQPHRRIERIRTALDRRQFATVLRRAPRWFGTPWESRARIAAGIALVRLRRPEEALEVLATGDVSPASACILRAQAFVGLDRGGEAREQLRMALELEPGLESEVRRNMALAALLRDPPTDAYA